MTELEIIVGSTASSKAIKNAVNGEASNAGCVLNSSSTTNKIAAQSVVKYASSNIDDQANWT